MSTPPSAAAEEGSEPVQSGQLRHSGFATIAAVLYGAIAVVLVVIAARPPRHGIETVRWGVAVLAAYAGALAVGAARVRRDARTPWWADVPLGLLVAHALCGCAGCVAVGDVTRTWRVDPAWFAVGLSAPVAMLLGGPIALWVATAVRGAGVLVVAGWAGIFAWMIGVAALVPLMLD